MATIGTGGIDSNPYARLGLAPGASPADVKRAYRRLAMHHRTTRGREAFRNSWP